MAKCYVKAYYDWIEQTAALDDAERGRLFVAVLEYARSGEIMPLEGREAILFPVFKLVIDRDEQRSEVNRENGRRGGRPRKNKSEKNRKKANETEQKATKDIRHKTEDERHITKDIKQKTEDENNMHARSVREKEFESFWEAYPRKVGKEKARQAYDAVSVPIDRLLDAVEEQRRSRQWTKDNGQFIPNPATWLSQSRWEDRLENPNNPREDGVCRHRSNATPEELAHLRAVYESIKSPQSI